LLKANVEEVAGVFGSLPEDPWDIAKRMDMDKAAPPQTIVTFGERGALLTSDGDAWRVTPPRISKVNPIGAGDAFAAGYLKAVMDGRSPEDALRFAAAVAASDASTLEPGCIVPSELDSLLREARPAEHRRLRKT
jgi:fructose-1-phosphate kinase PfkB-like protein